MSGWDELTAAALVGTGRRTVTDDGLDLAHAPDRSPETLVLTAAAVRATARRAGWVPSPLLDTPRTACEPEARETCPPEAAQLLELLITGEVSVAGGTTPLIVEWLEGCTAAGRRVPHRLLIAVLQLGTRDRSLRAAINGALGARGAWLAQQNPTWQWAATGGSVEGPEAEHLWETATTSERIEVLAAVRRRNPADGRRLVESTWRAEAAKDRAAFLEVLAVGLGDEDEPFLEAALDDRAKSVRERAAVLLDRLPSSARAGRMAARLEPLVGASGRLRKKLTVALPPDPDEAAARDGLAVAPPPGTGAATWRMISIVAATPLRWWENRLADDAAGIVAMAKGNPDLLAGFSRAAAAQRNATWAAALAPRAASAELLEVLDAPTAGAVAAELLRRGALSDEQLAAVLAGLARPWPSAATDAFFARVRSLPTSRLITLCAPLVAAAASPEAATQVRDWLEDLAEKDARRPLLRRLHHALTLRQSISELFPIPRGADT